MSYRAVGLTSMVIFAAAVLAAMWELLQLSWILVAGYVVLNISATMAIAYAYCGKCHCRRHCCHVIVGPISYLLPRRAPGPYSLGDYLGMLGASALVFVYPFLWLPPLKLVPFLVLGLLGVVLMLTGVCPSCPNANCPSSRWPARLKRNTPAEDATKE